MFPEARYISESIMDEQTLLQYHNEDMRLKTFKSWPYKSRCACTPDKMASAGFFAEGPNVDSARCFVCLKSLEGWELSDDPWEEHKKHSPQCLFVQLKDKTLTLEDHVDLVFERNKNKIIAAHQKHREEALKLAEATRKVIKQMEKRKK